MDGLQELPALIRSYEFSEKGSQKGGFLAIPVYFYCSMLVIRIKFNLKNFIQNNSREEFEILNTWWTLNNIFVAEGMSVTSLLKKLKSH